MREQLLSHLPWFVSTVAKLPGISRISLLGSIATNKQNPKDIDVLVVVDDDLDLEPLARYGRKLRVALRTLVAAPTFSLPTLAVIILAERVSGENVARAYDL